MSRCLRADLVGEVEGMVGAVVRQFVSKTVRGSESAFRRQVRPATIRLWLSPSGAGDRERDFMAWLHRRAAFAAFVARQVPQ